MAGVPGAGGPVPKRSDQRRRANATEVPIEAAPGVPVGDGPPRSAGGGLPAAVVPPAARPEGDGPGHWPEPIRAWYVALTESQQRAWFEPSDWMTARLWCDRMALSWPAVPVNLMSAFQSVAAELLSTEGSRRRLRIELARAKPKDPDADSAKAATLSLVDELERELAG